MKKIRLGSLACIVAFSMMGLPWSRAVSALEIRVNAGDRLQKVNPEVFGSAIIYRGGSLGFSSWVSDQRDYEAARRKWNYYLPYVSELGPTVLRYPHGLGANNFQWKKGIGPIEQRSPDYDGPGMPQTFGTDEFLQYCEEIGAEAILVVNVSTGGKRKGTVEDAADWVEYCNAPDDGSNPGGGIDWAAKRAANGHKEPYGVKYWELGNEELFPSWEDYAARVRAYSEAMKAIDPTIKVGVIASGGGIDAVFQERQYLEYHDLMLERAGDAFDFWIHHSHAPGSDGAVDGFTIRQNGKSLSVRFSLESGGSYQVRIPVEGACMWGMCPRLRLWIDGDLKGDWTLQDVLTVVRTPSFALSSGEHTLRLQVDDLAEGNRITICQQVQFFREGDDAPVWVDLKNSLEFYHTFMGGWVLAQDVLKLAEPHRGGKPVFCTEVSSSYKPDKGPPYISKACYLREMLSLGCLYQVLLRQGVPLANYWQLFQEQDGLGVLEGVAHDGMAEEIGRLDPRRRPVFHLLKAYRWNTFDWVVSTEVIDAPTFLVGRQRGMTLVYAQRNFEVSYVQALGSVSEDGDKLSLFVINLMPEDDLRARVRLEGFDPKPWSKVLTINGPSLGASNDPEDCPSGNCVTTTESRIPVGPEGFDYVFPKHSVTVFVFHRVGVDEDPPLPPTGLVGFAGERGILLTWDANSEQDLAGYVVYRSRVPEGPFRYRVNRDPLREPEFVDTRLDEGVTYTYAVKSVDRAGNESGFSNKIAVTAGSGHGPDDPPVGGGDRTPPSPPILLHVN